MEPRPYRDRYKPPKRFLQHVNMAGRMNTGLELYPNMSAQGEASQVFSSDIQTLLLPATPDEIRGEVDLLLSDLIVRLKQLLFNSLLCAYYVGFIPMQFAEVSYTISVDASIQLPDFPLQNFIYYDRWWSIELSFFIWANSFVILAAHLLPPSYCHLLHQCALHLGCWAKCSPVLSAPK